MVKNGSSLCKISVIIFVFFVLNISSALFNVASVKATDRTPNQGYFTGNYYSGTGNKVVRDGVPDSVNSKSTFINFVKRLYQSSRHENDRIGAAYIIQTMRGADANGNWDHGWPNSSDIADWENKINSSAITYRDEGYNSGVNTKAMPGGLPENVTDVVKYYDDNNESSIVFYYNNKIVYVVKRSCGNPLGDLPGLPMPYDYTLTPSVKLDVSDFIESNVSFNVTPSVRNSGPTESKDTQWELTQIVVKPGADVPKAAGGKSATAPCGTFFKSVDANCSTVDNGETIFANGNRRLAIYPANSGDNPVGTKICYALSVQPFKDDDDRWSHSAPVCLVIGKKPKVQVWGGSLLVDGNIKTSTSVKTNSTFGSWAEYSIFAGGTNNGMASGSAFAGLGLANSTRVCDYSSLSFANTESGRTSCNNSSPTIGYYNYKNSRLLPDIAASFTGGVDPGATVTPNNLLAGSGIYIGNRVGNLTLKQSQLDPGKSIILKVNGTVTIDGNQTYNPDNNGAKYTNITQLPQLVIIANKIVINGAVTNVDAWLVASGLDEFGVDGIIETCDTGSTKYTLVGAQRLTINKCNSVLTVNGPVIAKQLWLRRTAGSGTGASSGDPAEIFNLRADAYLWSIARALVGGKVQTVYTSELPPRF